MKLACTALLICLLSVSCITTTAGPPATTQMPAFAKDAVILFQGDSITDSNRGRNADPNHVMGHGYAFIIAAKYGSLLAERNLTFLNRGVSGNRVSNLQDRWQHDTLALKPDVLSILVGINDANGGVSAAEYEERYEQLLAHTVAALPKIILVICEPFRLPVNDRVKTFQDIASRLAEKYHAPLVRFQHVFEEAEQRVDGKYWIWDAVHPTYSGHQLMADEWVRTVEAFYGQPQP